MTACGARVAPAATAAVAATITAAIAATTATAAAPPGRKEVARRFGQAGHAGRVHDHLPLRSRAEALAAHFRFGPQCQVDHAALAAVHGVEAEGLARALHLL